MNKSGEVAKPTAAHTPGPWELRRDSEGHWIEWRGASIAVCLSGNGGLSPDEPASNAARIVACVNACEQFEDPAEAVRLLQIEAAKAYPAERERDSLRAEVERLRDALDRIANGLEVDGRTMDAMTKAGAAAQARAALRGGK